MKDIATLAIPANTLCRLLQYAAAHPTEASAGELAAIAIDEWLARADGDVGPPNRHRGYQWKTVFLPEGTQLRAWNRAGYAYAEVIADSIIYQGHPVSPHEFICQCKGVSRNAWAEVALLFPAENHWKRADACRREQGKCPQPPVVLAPTPAPLSILPPDDASAAAPTSWRRLPRVPPIPTQARLQQNAGTIANAAQPLATPDRRLGYRRQQDQFLD